MSVQIYVIARPHFDVEAFLSFLHEQGTFWRRSPAATAAEEIVEVAGRVCYMSFGGGQSPKTNKEYIRHLVRMEHESVLEHVNWTFLLAGVSRAFTHQLVRHRLGFAFSQLSQQYHDETDAEFVRPALALPTPALAAWEKVMRVTRDAYREILGSLHELEQAGGLDAETKRETRRAVRSAARSVLPNATETKIVVTANARALRYFLSVRGCIIGDLEMRQVAAAILRALKPEAPSLFNDFEVEILPDGLPIVTKHEAVLEDA